MSLSDPESRVMKQGGGGGYGPSYNMQVSTDAGHKIIVGVGVTQAGVDYEQLQDAERRIEDNLGRPAEQLVVDGGFVSRDNILAMVARGVELLGPLEEGVAQSAGQMKRRGVDRAFYPDRFEYDASADTYGCPAGK